MVFGQVSNIRTSATYSSSSSMLCELALQFRWALSRPAGLLRVSSSSLSPCFPTHKPAVAGCEYQAIFFCTHASHLDATHKMHCSACRQVWCAVKCLREADVASVPLVHCVMPLVCSAAAGQRCRGRCWACMPPSMSCTRHSHGAYRAGAWKPTSRAWRQAPCSAPGRIVVNMIAMR